MKIIFSDDFHLNRKNFSKLYEFLDENKTKPTFFVKSWNDNMFCGGVGNYRHLEEQNYLSVSLDELKDKTDNELFKFTYKGIKIWPLIHSELCAFTIAEAERNNLDFPKTKFEVFDFHFREFKNDLVYNYCCAIYWIDHFKDRERELWTSNAAFIFSGSYIYTKVLLEFFKKSPVKCFVVESTFLGINFYCDEQYEHLPNNYLHQYKNEREKSLLSALESVKIENSDDKLDYLRSRSINRFMQMDNKNVSQPPPCSIPKFKNSAKNSVLLIGQVLNDFSILESNNIVNSIKHYIEILNEILSKTDANIIVKTHPWEKRKIHLTDSVTFNALQKFRLSLGEDDRDRIFIDQDINIYHLISNVDVVLTYCSQSGIEAANFGKKVIVNEECSYQGCGFTESYSRIEELPRLIENNKDLTIDEYETFLDFMVSFDYMAISNEASSFKKLSDKLSSVSLLREFHRSLSETSIRPFFN